MNELSRKVRIESQKRALVADSLHGQEGVRNLAQFTVMFQSKGHF